MGHARFKFFFVPGSPRPCSSSSLWKKKKNLKAAFNFLQCVWRVCTDMCSNSTALITQNLHDGWLFPYVFLLFFIREMSLWYWYSSFVLCSTFTKRVNNADLLRRRVVWEGMWNSRVTVPTGWLSELKVQTWTHLAGTKILFSSLSEIHQK